MNGDQARALLGLEPGYTLPQLEAAFRAHAATSHPDRGGDPEHFKQLVESRFTLISNRDRAHRRVVVVGRRQPIVRLLDLLRQIHTPKPPRVE